MVKPARAAGEGSGDHESMEPARSLSNGTSPKFDSPMRLDFALTFATTARWQTKHQRSRGRLFRKRFLVLRLCDLESHFSCSFIYVRLAIHRNPGGNLRPHCSCENSQVWRRARRKGHRDGRAGCRLHGSCARYYGHPTPYQHDLIGSRTVTTTFH